MFEYLQNSQSCLFNIVLFMLSQRTITTPQPEINDHLTRFYVCVIRHSWSHPLDIIRVLFYRLPLIAAPIFQSFILFTHEVSE